MKFNYYEKKMYLIINIFSASNFSNRIGCTGGVATPLTDEAKIKNMIQEFCLALNEYNEIDCICIIFSRAI